MSVGIIYAYRNKVNNKYYVGLTSQDPKRRWKKDGNGYKGQDKFWKAIQKYGWENFEHIILEDNVDVLKLEERERYWIDQYNSIENGYNIRYGPCEPQYFKQKISDGWTKALREWKSAQVSGEKNPMYGSHRINEAAAHKSPVVCITTGQFFPTLKQACEWAHRSKNSLLANIKNKSSYCGVDSITGEKLKWRYATKEESEKYYECIL